MAQTPSKLAIRLRDEIRLRGPIPFRAFMEQALYDSADGYYTSGRARLGRGGDYFTNVSVGPLFGTLLARQFSEIWQRLGEPATFTILEQGAHAGDFARDTLRALQANAPALFRTVRYHFVEPAPALRAAQKMALAEFASRVTWDAALTELDAFEGVHFSNELIDSFPVHAVIWTGREWREQHVDFKDDRFVFIDGPLTGLALDKCVAGLPIPEFAGARRQLNLAALEWIEQVAAKLRRGYLLTIDYGHLRSEAGDTLSAFFRHRREPDPLARPGEVDLTAHINFTSLIEHAETRGLRLHGFTDQHHFMVALGKEHFPDTVELSAERAREMRAFKTLMHPEMMGTQFKVLCMEKDVAERSPLLGFQFAADPRVALGMQ